MFFSFKNFFIYLSDTFEFQLEFSFFFDTFFDRSGCQVVNHKNSSVVI